MLFRDQLAFIFQHLKKSKLRVAMTVLATTIGCAFLITLASVAFGFQKTFEDELLSDPNLTEISLWEGGSLTDEKLEKVIETEHVNAVIEQNNVNSSVEMAFEDRSGFTQGVIYNIDALSKLPSELKEGRLPQNENEIVVGKGVSTYLLSKEDEIAIDKKAKEAEANGTWYNGQEEGYKGSLLNKSISFKIKDENENILVDKTFTVVGVKKDPDYEYNMDNEVMFHHALKQQLTEDLLYTEHVIHVDTMENVLPVLEQLKADGIQVYSPLEQMDEINMVFLAIKVGLIFVGAIAVIIASIGIFNTMTMAVTERTREIGVLKAIGATPALIQRLFLMESLLIGVIGTAIAIVISYAISVAGNLLAPILFEQMLNNGEAINFKFTFSLITPSLLIIATSISLFVALLSGWRPARNATKIEVVKALQQL
jgi:acetoin utilization transport system permease protein